MTAPACRECGNDDGPYDGFCLDCLEEGVADQGSVLGHGDPPTDVLVPDREEHV